MKQTRRMYGSTQNTQGGKTVKGWKFVPCLAMVLLLVPAVSRADAPTMRLQTGTLASEAEGVETGKFRLDRGDEPEGFGSFKWGEDLSKAPGMTQVGVSGASSVFTRKEEGKTLGLVAKVKKVLYYSYDGKFYSAKVFLEPGQQNWEALKAAVVEKYGPGYNAGGGDYLFIGKDAGLHLRTPPANAETWSLSVFSKPLTREADAAARKMKQKGQ